jgi:cytochrome c-type biogenesis protein CcmE
LLLFLSIVFAIIILLVLRSLEKNVVYFFSPTEVSEKTDISFGKKIRIGGLVKVNSVKKNEQLINFIITDLKNEIIVSYNGLVPNLFSEGKGVVAEGKLKDKKYFIASKILAKHDENYMPPEVSEALEKKDN